MIFASAKDGEGVKDVLQAVVDRVPPPTGQRNNSLRALIFDSRYDSYKGVVAYIRVFDGIISRGSRLRVMSNSVESEILEIGCFRPDPVEIGELEAGDVGYVATGLKVVGDVPVGDTITSSSGGASVPIAPYEPLKPMVFAGLYPTDGRDYLNLRDALEKLSLNDSSLSFQPESSVALGPGFRCGFLGLLHMDVVQERLEREYELSLLATSPGVKYQVLTKDEEILEVDNPSGMPETQYIEEVLEPWIDLSIITPDNYIGPLMELVTSRRGEFKKMDYIQQDNMTSSESTNFNKPSRSYNVKSRVMMEFNLPLSEMLIDFYDQLKSRTQGYASMDYSLSGYRSGKLVRLDILVAGNPVDALSVIVDRSGAYSLGKDLVTKLKDLIPRQMFEVPIQASIGGKVQARETVKALRKNVLAKCYGGDVTRKRKLLERQAEGKKRMKRVGRVEIPQEAFLSVLKVKR